MIREVNPWSLKEYCIVRGYRGREAGRKGKGEGRKGGEEGGRRQREGRRREEKEGREKRKRERERGERGKEKGEKRKGERGCRERKKEMYRTFFLYNFGVINLQKRYIKTRVYKCDRSDEHPVTSNLYRVLPEEKT